MKNVCDQLLALHERRLSQHERQLVQARAALQVCEQAHAQRQHALQTFDKERPQRERFIFERVVGRTVARGVIDELVVDLGALSDERQHLEASLMESEDELQQARSHLDEVTSAWRLQMRRVEKLREWARAQRQQQAVEAQLREDREADDWNRVKPAMSA